MTIARVNQNRCPLPGANRICVSCYIPASSSEINILVPVPEVDVMLTHAETNVVTAIGASTALEIDIEVNASGGTEIGSITVAASSAVGTIDSDTTITKTRLSCEDAAIDYLCIEAAGQATGAVMLYLYFEKYIP